MIKYSTAEEAVRFVKPGNRVFIHGSAATPVHLVKALQNRHYELENVELVSITNLGDIDFDKPEYRKTFFFNSLFVSAAVRGAVNSGMVDYVPVFLSEIPVLFKQGILPIDVALVGIGENGHLAFNDPPADFEIEAPYIIVTLDTECRQQQFNEGWFKSIEDVPAQAISMSIKQICKSEQIICSVPDNRKARAVKNSLEEKVNNLVPASILQLHHGCTFYLDRLSSSLLMRQN